MRRGGEVPESLLARLRPLIERPTFGQGCEALRILTAEGPDGDNVPVVAELHPFARSSLLPLLTGRSPDDDGLISLRNRLAHGGPMGRAAAAEALGRWGPRWEEVVAAAGFLGRYRVGHHSGGRLRLLRGTAPAATPPEPLPVGEAAAPLPEGHIVLVGPAGWLDLWPLCLYDALGERRPGGQSAEYPLMYARAMRDRLYYSALGADVPGTERMDVLERFRSLFAIRRVEGPKGAEAEDFETEIRADSEALVGRRGELASLKAAVKARDEGVIWVGGPGGIGKSLLMARLAVDLGNSPNDTCRIAWRFRAGDGARGHRAAFLAHAITRLAGWLGKSGTAPEPDTSRRLAQLESLLEEAGGRPPGRPGRRPPRVVFVLDGLDELDRSDPEFASVPLRLSRPRVIWVCAGRPEGSVARAYDPSRCHHAFEGGLGPMSREDLRAMLVDGTGALKYDLIRLDRETTDAETGRPAIENAAVEVLLDRAGGLPLYVHYVIQDLLAGNLSFDRLARELPSGLEAYYARMLGRLGLGDLSALMTPLAVTLAWASAPLDLETLHTLLSRRRIVRPGEEGRARLRQALGQLGSMIRTTPSPGSPDEYGYELYHLTLREHLRADPDRVVPDETARALDAFESLAREWGDLPRDGPARRYVLRHGPRTLADARRWDALATLVTEVRFLEAKAADGLAYEAADDLDAAAAAWPPDRSAARLVGLLARIFRAEVPLIDRRPPWLFQCLWNRGWWHDGPEAAEERDPAELSPGLRPPSGRDDFGLSGLLERWRREKEADPGFLWVRSLRPPSDAISPALRLVLRGHEDPVKAVAFSRDGGLLASGDAFGNVIVWDTAGGLPRDQVYDGYGAVDQLTFDPERPAVGWVRARRKVSWRAFESRRSGREARRADGGVIEPPDHNSEQERRFLAMLAKIEFHEEMKCCSFSADGRLMIRRGDDHRVRITDARGEVQMAAFRDQRYGVHALSVSNSGDRVAVLTKAGNRLSGNSPSP